MKKSNILLAVAAVAMLAAGCAKNVVSPDNNPAGTHTVTINTGDAGISKTVISPSGKGYTVSWQEGDMIQLYEIAPELKETVRMYFSEPLKASDIKADGSASFKVEIDNSRAGASSYQYVAVYPAEGPGTLNFTEWTGEDDKMYASWAEEWGYKGAYPGNHAIAEMYLLDSQCAPAGSFAPAADIMISKVNVTGAQLTEAASMQFSRIGAIIKIKLSGLEKYAGMSLENLRFCPGPSYAGNGPCQVDMALNKVRTSGKASEFNIYPQGDVPVEKDGTLSVWLRAYAGTVTDGFSVTLTLANDKKDVVELTKEINLAKLGRTLAIPEGKLTEFTVGEPWSTPAPAKYLYVYPSTTTLTSDPGSIELTVDSNIAVEEINFRSDDAGVSFTRNGSTVTMNYGVGSYDAAKTLHVSASADGVEPWEKDFSQPQRVFDFSAATHALPLEYTSRATESRTISGAVANFIPATSGSAAWLSMEASTYTEDGKQKIRAAVNVQENTENRDREGTLRMYDPYYPERGFDVKVEQYRAELGGRYYIVAYGYANYNLQCYLMGDYTVQEGLYGFSAIPVTLDEQGRIVETAELTANRAVTVEKTANGYTLRRYVDEYSTNAYLKARTVVNSFAGFNNQTFNYSNELSSDGKCLWNISWRKDSYNNRMITDIYCTSCGSSTTSAMASIFLVSKLATMFGVSETNYVQGGVYPNFYDPDKYTAYAHAYFTNYEIVLIPAE